jgi:hypothetical protein
LEQYLSAALQSVGRLDQSRANTVTNSLRVIRPYGSLGRLPWQDAKGIEFGFDPFQSGKLEETAKGIITYTEQTDHRNVRAEISTVISNAELIIFIGFGFHQKNLTLLKSRANDRPVFATAFQIDRDNYELFSSDLARYLGTNVRLFDRKGYDFMKALRPTISAAAS